MSRKPGTNDFFADVASQQAELRRAELIEPGPPKLPDILLPLRGDGTQVMPDAVPSIRTPEALQKELERFRTRFAPFMENHAPPLPSLRSALPLQIFDWRIQTQADQQDFLGVLQGEGEWESVPIPHLGPPLGLATTYYRTTFTVTEAQRAVGRAVVCFAGVDYRAHAFVNGSYVGSHEGFFAPFECDFTDHARVGENVLVVRVENDAVGNGNQPWGQDYAGDKIYAATGPGYDDPQHGWHHCPPGMGIYQSVRIEFRSPLTISDIYVRPLPEQGAAELWLDIHVAEPRREDIRLTYSVFGRNFHETLFEKRAFHPTRVCRCGFGDDLAIAKAKAAGIYEQDQPLPMEKGLNFLRIPFDMEGFRWWTPDEPWLYQVQIELTDSSGTVVDRAERHFGMRSFTMRTASKPKGALYLNGDPIRLRGANTMGHEQQCVMKGDFDQLRDDLLLARICNMNFLRLTQRPVQDEVYTLCDMLGLMVQTDLPTFGSMRRNLYCELLRQVEEMEKLVRAHPSCIMISYINEPCPDGGSGIHRNLGRNELEDLFRAADDIVHRLNPERVIKPCDGDYDPPAPGIQDRHCYMGWYNGQGVEYGRLHQGCWQATKPDWYYGCGEFGAEGLERAELMRKAYPASWMPQPGEDPADWTPSRIIGAQTGMFHHFFFDRQTSVESWVAASQQYQAQCLRMMAEAFRRDNRMNTFAVHLFIDAFPSGWMKTIMDCERHPKQGYYAYRDALAPLLPTLRTDRSRLYGGEALHLEAWICNDLPEAPGELTLHYGITLADEVLTSGMQHAQIDVCAARFQGVLAVTLPEVSERTIATARLTLVDGDGVALNSTELDIEVFPNQRVEDVGKVIVVGAPQGQAARLAADMNAAVVDAGEPVYLIDDFALFDARRQEITDAVRSGARAVFLPLPLGDYHLADTHFTVKSSTFNSLHFASRKTGHPLVDGFAPHDFRHWHDPEVNRIAPLLEATFAGDAFRPILNAGNTNPAGEWCEVLAAGELPLDQGSFVVCQVDLAGRTSTNPPARTFAARLLTRRDG